jgi:hypothetical protein
MTGLLKAAFLERMQQQKKIKNWGCSVGIPPLS